MYTFAVIALLALGTVKIVDALTDMVSALRPWRSLLTFVVAVGGVLLLDFSMFSGFGVSVDNESLATWITGFCVAGMTVPWRAVFGFLTHDRANADETLGEQRMIRAA